MSSAPTASSFAADAKEAWVLFAPDGTVCGAHSNSPSLPAHALAWHQITRADRLALLAAIDRVIGEQGAHMATANGWRVERRSLDPPVPPNMSTADG